MQRTTAGDRQTLIDMAIEHAGAAEAVKDLCLLNDLSITEDLVNGQALALPPVANKFVRQFFKTEKIKPASTDNDWQEGIGYWFVNYDFIIQ